MKKILSTGSLRRGLSCTIDDLKEANEKLEAVKKLLSNSPRS
jgi:hypothetical protein